MTVLDAYALAVALVLLVLPFVDWTASVILRRGTRRVNSIALRERANVAVILAVVTTLNAVVGANRLFGLHLDNGLVLVLLGASLVLAGVPNLYWLGLYLRSRRSS